MRFALALLFAAAAVAPAVAQGTSPAASKPTAQGTAPGAASKPEEVLRQRILLRERFNKGWDIRPETAQERQRRCKSEAKKHYSAIHPFKRRKFAKDCIAGANR
jgi:hypothetical protein